MSLETALAENTAALQALMRTIRENASAAAAVAIGTAQATSAPKAQTAAATPAPAATAPSPAPSQTTAAPADAPAKTDAAPTHTAESAAADASASTAAPTYDETATAIKNVVKAKGRDAGVAVLHSFNPDAASLKDIGPEHFAAVIAACKKATQ